MDPLVLGELSQASAAPISLTDVGRTVTKPVSDRVGIPAALLPRAHGVWQFEAEARPDVARAAATGFAADPDRRWTGIGVGGAARWRRWMLLLPGSPSVGEGTSVVSHIVPETEVLLEDAAERKQSDEWKRTAQRYHRFCRRLIRAQTADDLYGLVLCGLAAQVRADVGALAVYSEADRQLSIVKTLGYPQQLVDHLRIAPGEGVLGSVFKSGRPALATAAPNDQPRRLRYRTESYVAVPLSGPAGTLGVVAFTDHRDGTPFSAADLSALRLLADPAALALTVQSVRQAADEVTRLASIDSLTGLFNRRYFDTRLEAELQRARRHGEPLTLLMVDIDNFKVINDEHGHLAGDRSLRCVSERLRRGVRIFDVCARYGGDEFAILMPSSSVETAVLVAERIRTSVRGHCTQAGGSVTVSIGIAHSDGREGELLSIADRALFEAKARGKNTVRVGEKLT